MKKCIWVIAAAGVLLCFAVLALAIQNETSRNNPQLCGPPTHARLFQRLGLFAQNGGSQPCATNPADGTCASPGSPCIDANTGRHGKCVTSGTNACTCQPHAKGGKKKGGKH